MAEEEKFGVKNFNSQNYQLWKMKMGDYLYQKDLFLQLGRKASKLMNMKDKEWEVLDKKVLGTIWMLLDSLVDFNNSK